MALALVSGCNWVFPYSDPSPSSADGPQKVDGRSGDTTSTHDQTQLPDAEPHADALPPPAACAPLPWPEHAEQSVTLSPGDEDLLRALVAGEASPGTVIRLRDGAYSLQTTGGEGVDGLDIAVEGIALRSASDTPGAVVISGGYQPGALVTIHAPDVTLAHLTLRAVKGPAVWVLGPEVPTAGGPLLYGLIVEDALTPGAIQPGNSDNTAHLDGGEIACSTLRITEEGRAVVEAAPGQYGHLMGVQGYGVSGWTVRDCRFEELWHGGGGLSGIALRFGYGSRDTLLERNVVKDCAAGLWLGMTYDTGSIRTYSDSPCLEDDSTPLQHVGGVIRNNVVVNVKERSGIDTGIAVWDACQPVILHNTVISIPTPGTGASIEWRYPRTHAIAHNNLHNHKLWTRESGTADAAGSVRLDAEGMPSSADTFVELFDGDLHLRPDATVIDQGVTTSAAQCPDDLDGQLRDERPDVGADER